MGAADSPDYLRLPVAWTPSRRFEHGQPYEYRLMLNADEVAALQRVAGRGWSLTIIDGSSGRVSERGLFATPHDALMAVYAEYFVSA